MTAAKRHNMRGITILSAVFLGIALAGGLFWYYYKTSREQAAKVEAKRLVTMVQIKTLERVVWQYRIATGNFPASLADIKPYLGHEFPLDPWGRAYIYRYPGERSPDPEILSYGADGKPGGTGENADILSSQVN